MPLSWNEIKDRALRFSREWQHESSEDAEAKSFWDGFFDVFGVSRRRVANLEKKVKKLDGKDGYIDLLWKGMLLSATSSSPHCWLPPRPSLRAAKRITPKSATAKDGDTTC